LISTTIGIAPLRQVVDAAPGKNHFRVIAELFSLVMFLAKSVFCSSVSDAIFVRAEVLLA